jgi:hypothetical protein
LVPDYSFFWQFHVAFPWSLEWSCNIIKFQGLGRNFLRHLRRTRVIVHVVDAAADDPVNDYKIVREVICNCFQCCLAFSSHCLSITMFTIYLIICSYNFKSVRLASVVT